MLEQTTNSHIEGTFYKKEKKAYQEQVMDVQNIDKIESGVSNLGSKTRKQLTSGQNKNERNQEEGENNFQERAERDQIIDSEKTIKCGRFQLTPKRIVIIVTCSILIISAIVIPIAVYFGTRVVINNDGPVYYYPIRFKGKELSMVSSSIAAADNIGYTLANRMGTKTDATQPYTEVTARCERDNDQKQNQCSIIVPILQLLSSNNWDELEQTKNDWLAEYNNNPRNFVDRFVTSINKVVQTQSPGDKDKIEIKEIEEELLIDVKYNDQKEIFELAKYDTDQETEDKSANGKNTQLQLDQSNWVDSVLEKTSKKLKQIVLENLNVIQRRSSDIVKQQQKFAKDEQIKDKWEEALINKCRTLSQGLFRCALDAVDDLVPGFEGDKDRSKIPADAILTYAFELKIKDYRV